MTNEHDVFAWLECDHYQAFVDTEPVGPGYQHELGFRRDEYLRYGTVEFAVERSECGIEAFVHADVPEVTWLIQVVSPDDNLPSRYSSPKACTPVHSPRVVDWPGLAGAEITIEFAQDELFFECGGESPVILPDTPATMYVGFHSALNEHRLKFSPTHGSHQVIVEWKCNAYAYHASAPVPVSARATLLLRSITVWTEDRVLRRSEAVDLVRQKFPGITTSAPTRTSSGFEFLLAAEA